MSVVYVITDGDNPTTDRYKLGSHTGDYGKLLTRYITIMPGARILYFVQTLKALEIESKFKLIHQDKRISNVNGHPSEWYRIKIDEMLKTIGILLVDNHCIEVKENTNTEINIKDKQDRELIKKYKEEGIKLVDKQNGINFTAAFKIPSDDKFDKHRDLLKLTNRVYKREQRSRDINMGYTQCTMCRMISSLSVNTDDHEKAHIQMPTNKIITTPTFIIEIID